MKSYISIGIIFNNNTLISFGYQFLSMKLAAASSFNDFNSKADALSKLQVIKG